MATELRRILMPYNCDTVEFCKDRQRFIVGTYEHEKTNDEIRRLGSLSLFRASNDSFVEISSCSTASGVLDIKFLPNGNDEFIMPMADGTVRLGRVAASASATATAAAAGDNDEAVEVVSCSEPARSDVALAVSCRDSQKISAAFSSGYVRQYQLAQDGIRTLSAQKVHELEAWAVLAKGDRILTGGDDSTLRCTDSSGSSSRVLRVFEAGVTAIENDVHEHHILVGTYEDKLYQFDLRNMKQATKEMNFGGGVWRIKQNPYDSRFVAIAAMYAGAFVFNRQTWTQVSKYEGHASICYGVAWKDPERVISCSFYDRVLAMWKSGITDEHLVSV